LIISISFGGHPIAPDTNDLDALFDVQLISRTKSAEIINIFILMIEPPMSFMLLKHNAPIIRSVAIGSVNGLCLFNFHFFLHSRLPGSITI
jgi:hypothetical protein